MSKIVPAANAMIANKELIEPVLAGTGEDEFFFNYKRKYKWSIAKVDPGHTLWYYPGELSLEALAATHPENFEGIPSVRYSDQEIGTREAKATFAELFTVVKERLYGMDSVLSDIIGSKNVEG